MKKSEQQDHPGIDRLIDLTETARQLGVGERKAYGLWLDGTLPSVLVGRNRRMRLSELQAFIANLQPA